MKATNKTICKGCVLPSGKMDFTKAGKDFKAEIVDYHKAVEKYHRENKRLLDVIEKTNSSITNLIDKYKLQLTSMEKEVSVEDHRHEIQKPFEILHIQKDMPDKDYELILELLQKREDTVEARRKNKFPMVESSDDVETVYKQYSAYIADPTNEDNQKYYVESLECFFKKHGMELTAVGYRWLTEVFGMNKNGTKNFLKSGKCLRRISKKQYTDKLYGWLCDGMLKVGTIKWDAPEEAEKTEKKSVTKKTTPKKNTKKPVTKTTNDDQTKTPAEESVA